MCMISNTGVAVKLEYCHICACVSKLMLQACMVATDVSGRRRETCVSIAHIEMFLLMSALCTSASYCIIVSSANVVYK